MRPTFNVHQRAALAAVSSAQNSGSPAADCVPRPKSLAAPTGEVGGGEGQQSRKFLR